ncbi:MAG: hypothetical protein WCT19_02465 [Candidatus Paceibacterota bacterium]|jgi:hypothetical protein
MKIKISAGRIEGLQIFFCFFLILSVLDAIFWLSWAIHFGSVPLDRYGVSRWFDVLIQPLWVGIIVAFIALLPGELTGDEHPYAPFKGLQRCAISTMYLLLFLITAVSMIIGFALGIVTGLIWFLPVGVSVILGITIEILRAIFGCRVAQ